MLVKSFESQIALPPYLASYQMLWTLNGGEWRMENGLCLHPLGQQIFSSTFNPALVKQCHKLFHWFFHFGFAKQCSDHSIAVQCHEFKCSVFISIVCWSVLQCGSATAPHWVWLKDLMWLQDILAEQWIWFKEVARVQQPQYFRPLNLLWRESKNLWQRGIISTVQILIVMNLSISISISISIIVK